MNETDRELKKIKIMKPPPRKPAPEDNSVDNGEMEIAGGSGLSKRTECGGKTTEEQPESRWYFSITYG